MHLENKTNSILYKGYHTTKKNGKHWQCSEKKNLNNILNMFGSDNTRNSVVERQIFGTTRFQFELYRVSVWINWCVSNLATEVIQLPRKRNLISSRVTVRRYLCTRIEATGMDFLGLLSSVSSGRKQVGVATCVVAYFVRREPPILSYPTDFLPSLQKSILLTKLLQQFFFERYFAWSWTVVWTSSRWTINDTF